MTTVLKIVILVPGMSTILNTGTTVKPEKFLRAHTAGLFTGSMCREKFCLRFHAPKNYNIAIFWCMVF